MLGDDAVTLLNVTFAPTVSPADEYIAPPSVAVLPLKAVLSIVALPPVTESAPPEYDLLELNIEPEIDALPPVTASPPP